MKHINNPNKDGYIYEKIISPLLPILPRSVHATGPITASLGSKRLKAAILNNSSGLAKAIASTMFTSIPNCKNAPNTPTSSNMTKKNQMKKAVNMAVSCLCETEETKYDSPRKHSDKTATSVEYMMYIFHGREKCFKSPHTILVKNAVYIGIMITMKRPMNLPQKYCAVDMGNDSIYSSIASSFSITTEREALININKGSITIVISIYPINTLDNPVKPKT